MGRPEEMRAKRRLRARRRRLLALPFILIAAVVGAVALRPQGAPVAVASGTSATTTLPAGGHPTTTSTTAVAVSTATYSFPAADQASWVAQENARPGSPDWVIQGKTVGKIEGFADHVSASAGESVQLYVSTDAESFIVKAYRMGWYGGAGARLVWTSNPVPGNLQQECDLDRKTNMVSCDNWTPSLSLGITSDFVQGDYLLKLVGSGGQLSYVPLTVTDPTSQAAFLVENDIYTWQAWNTYGGYDFYAGVGNCGGTYPVCNRARVVSFDRPYATGDGTGDFLGNEYPLVRFMEQQGLDLTYATSSDIEQSPDMVLQHRVLLSLGHDECWSYLEREAAQQAEAAGVNMVFFGASAVLRHVRMEASPLGDDRQEVDYRNSASDPLDGTGDPKEVTGNTWSDPPASWTEVPFVGEEYTGYVEPGVKAVPFVVYEGSSWLFAGTGLQTGDRVPGLLVSDFDQVEPGVSPSNIEVLAHSPMPRGEVQTSVGNPSSDTAYWTDNESGAGIFDTGTVTWIPDLQSSSVVNQMTANLLSLFGRGPVGTISPSTPNWRHQY